MNDIEISKALALAIGWKKAQMRTKEKRLWLRTHGVFSGFWSPFDYRDWNVIGPIAERYDVFPYKLIIGEKRGYWNAVSRGKDTIADTPQKAIALAVIEGAKK